MSNIRFGFYLLFIVSALQLNAQDNSQKTFKIIFEKLPQLDLFFCICQLNMAGRDAADATQGDNMSVNNAYLYTTRNIID